MDLSYSDAYERFRDDVKSFLTDHWPLTGAEAKLPEHQQAALFRRRAIERGYLARSVPREFGGSGQSPDALKATIIREEFGRVRAPADVRGIGPSMLVPTLVEKGERWQQERFIAPTVAGEMIWCQGYSEPGSGSDLASLATRAELVDEEWVINGQKIWTSGAQHADYMFCLARTEPDATKHAGISYLLIDMKQPGIAVQPLKQITGGSTFNQVFLTNARTPADWIVGKRGEGWLVSRSTLKHERNSIGNAAQSIHIFNRLVELAQRAEINGTPALDDPDVRQRLIRIEGYVRSHEYSGYRQLTRAAHDRPPGLIGLMNKLVSTNISQEIGRLAYDMIGDHGLLESRDWIGRTSPERGWIGQWMGSLGGAIAGGTSNIQRNIIAERGLGLPRDAAAQRSE